MTQSTSLIEFLLNLLRDPEAREQFLEDGDGYLAECGIDHLSAADLHDSLLLLQESQDASFDREYNTGGNTVTVATPPPPPAGDDNHEDAVQYLNNYITNNYVDDSDTIIDNSVNQNIETDGGDFEQNIDIDPTIATGDGAVAVGGDVEDSEIVTGDDNVVGDDNVTGDGNLVGDDNEAVIGDDNTTSFGSGDATSAEIDGDVSVSEGGAFSIGGDAEGSFEEEDNDTEVTTTFEDSFNNETTTETSFDESFNDESSTEVESNSNSNNQTDINA